MTSNVNFEQALTELEQLIQRMEQGDLALETSLQEYERGVQLIRICQDILKTAEQRVTLLSAEGTSHNFPVIDEPA